MSTQASNDKARALSAAERIELAMSAVAARGNYLGGSGTDPAHASGKPANAATTSGHYSATTVLRLLAWPDLRTIPDSQLMATARVCALLARQPSVADLAARRLGVPEDDVRELTQHLLSKGLLRPVNPAPGKATQAEPVEPGSTDQEVRHGIWHKLMKRLMA